MSNRLAQETSPYLLQHAHNPVDWYPWGDEALARAAAEDKPVFLSIGYSACHWCHVMERESFEDAATARLMNELFVSVKVDREERPDLDQIYQTAVQLLGGHGGWPLTVFLTPDGQPFFGGTYFPPAPRYGMSSFSQVLIAIAEAWRARRKDVVEQAGQLAGAIRQMSAGETRFKADADAAILAGAERQLLQRADLTNGGFGDKPKFPSAMNVAFLQRAGRSASARAHAALTLVKMAEGGIYDQLGGGFHRYSTDDHWLVPHFEKMLYDNALLVPLYAELWREVRPPLAARIVRETLDYLAREMQSPEGGFYATQDADSEGPEGGASIEGKFFAWTPSEVRTALGDALGEHFCRAYGVTDTGTFEHGASVLQVVERDDALADACARLFTVRELRKKPHRDEKVLTSWNGLALAAFASGARALGEPGFLATAQRAARFALEKLAPAGGVRRTYKDGVAKLPGTLDDYAFLAHGLFELYQTDFDARWLEASRALATAALAKFADPAGGFYLTESGDGLLARPRSSFDNAVPSGGAVLTRLLLRLHALDGDAAYEEAAKKTLEVYAGAMARTAFGFGELLCALDLWLAGPRVVVVAGDGPAADALVDAARAAGDVDLVVARVREGEAPPAALAALLEGKHAVDGAAAAYVCRRGTCSLPVTDAAALAPLLR